MLTGIFQKLFKREEKNCIVKQYHITVSGFTTQLEAFCMAEKICRAMQIDESRVSVRETTLEVSLKDYEKFLATKSELENKHQQ